MPSKRYKKLPEKTKDLSAELLKNYYLKLKKIVQLNLTSR